MQSFSPYESPKLALIRLLRSQGCCESQHQTVEDENVEHNEGLLRYKQELELKVAHQRAKIGQIPCALELGKQIEQLQQIIQGLDRENRHRYRIIKENYNQTYTSTQLSQKQLQHQQHQHESLQKEYQQLLKKLERTNKRNSSLVNKLATM